MRQGMGHVRPGEVREAQGEERGCRSSGSVYSILDRSPAGWAKFPNSIPDLGALDRPPARPRPLARRSAAAPRTKAGPSSSLLPPVQSCECLVPSRKAACRPPCTDRTTDSRRPALFPPVRIVEIRPPDPSLPPRLARPCSCSTSNPGPLLVPPSLRPTPASLQPALPLPSLSTETLVKMENDQVRPAPGLLRDGVPQAAGRAAAATGSGCAALWPSAASPGAAAFVGQSGMGARDNRTRQTEEARSEAAGKGERRLRQAARTRLARAGRRPVISPARACPLAGSLGAPGRAPLACPRAPRAPVVARRVAVLHPRAAARPHVPVGRHTDPTPSPL